MGHHSFRSQPFINSHLNPMAHIDFVPRKKKGGLARCLTYIGLALETTPKLMLKLKVVRCFDKKVLLINALRTLVKDSKMKTIDNLHVENIVF